MLGVCAPLVYAGDFTAGREAGAGKRALDAAVKIQADFVNVEVAVFGRDFAVFVNGEAFGECARAVQVGIGGLQVETHSVALAGDFGAFGMIAIKAEGDEQA